MNGDKGSTITQPLLEAEDVRNVFFVMDTERKVLFVDPAVEQMFGYSVSELQGQSIHALLDDRAFESFQEYVQISLENRGGGVPLSVLGMHRNLSTFPVTLTVTPFTENDRTLITTVIKQEQEIGEQADFVDQLRSVNEELRSFAYIVSHDLQAPLRGIQTVIQWLETDCGKQLDDQGQEYLGIMQGRIERMRRLIHGVLEYSRVGRLEENRTLVNVNALVNDIVEWLEVPEDVMVSFEDVLPQVWGDPLRIGQIFHGLISNAVQFMDKSPGFVKVCCMDDGDLWQFSVADNGPGIAEVQFERIFLIFQTLQSRDRHESAGVGLTIVKKIVDLYGGKIWLESNLGEGSTFFFTLPKYVGN